MAQNIAENFNHVSRLHGRQTDRRPTDRSCHKMNVITFTYSTDEHKTKKNSLRVLEKRFGNDGTKTVLSDQDQDSCWIDLHCVPKKRHYVFDDNLN